jgi:hypothetical protein
MFEDQVLKRAFGLKREELAGGWRKLHKRSFIVCTLHHMFGMQ